MDAQTNRLLRQLDRRLQVVYRDAYKTAIKNTETVLERLAAFNAQDNSHLTPAQLLTAQINYAKQVDRAYGITDNIVRDLIHSGDLAAKIIQNESLNIYELGYRNSLTSIDKQLGFDVDWSMYDRQQLRVLMLNEPKSPFTQVAFDRLGVNENRAAKVVIPRLQDQLMQAVILGESIPKITRRIQNTVMASLRDARRIARTETLRVANQGRMLGFEQARDQHGIQMRKKWLAAIDHRTRDSHAWINGEEKELDEPFSNGLMHPLDPTGPAEEVINCRCITTSVLKDYNFAEKHAIQTKLDSNFLPTDGKSGTISVENSMFPDALAGVKRGEPMSFDKANELRGNPDFHKGGGFLINCQSCVVTHEARLRGYNVVTLPNTKGSALDVLSRQSHTAWVDPATGSVVARPRTDVKFTSKSFQTHLETTVQQGERYTLGFEWKGRSRSGHIISVDRMDDGVLRLHDPQNGKSYTGNAVSSYLNRIKYEKTLAGNRFPAAPRLLRVDDKAFNMEVVNAIMKGAD